MDAGKSKLLFGKHKGQSIDEISETAEGLRYLDWLVGQDWLKPSLRRDLESFLSDPYIQQELEEALSEEREWFDD